MRKWYFVVIVVVTFLALLVSAGVRTTPSIIIKPLEDDFGWSRSAISFAVAISLFTFGFGAPLGGGLIDRFGPRRIMLGGLALIGAGALSSRFSTAKSPRRSSDTSASRNQPLTAPPARQEETAHTACR